MEEVIEHFLGRVFPDGDCPLDNPQRYMDVKPAPSATPLPLSKRILAADTRMTQELRRIGLNPEEIEMIKERREQERLEKEQKKAEQVRKKEQREQEKKDRGQKKLQKELERKAKEDKKEQDEKQKRLREQHKESVAAKKQDKKLRVEEARKQQGENQQRVGELRKILARDADDDQVECEEGEDEEAPVVPAPKRKRAPPNGPMTVAFNQFMKEQKERGVGWKDGLAMWKESDERQAIVSQMSAAERKRRRYD